MAELEHLGPQGRKFEEAGKDPKEEKENKEVDLGNRGRKKRKTRRSARRLAEEVMEDKSEQEGEEDQPMFGLSDAEYQAGEDVMARRKSIQRRPKNKDWLFYLRRWGLGPSPHLQVGRPPCLMAPSPGTPVGGERAPRSPRRGPL